MKYFSRLLLVRGLCALLLACGLAFSTASLAGQEKTVHVEGYTRKDGTKVEAYDRRPPTRKGEAGGAADRPADRADDGVRPAYVATPASAESASAPIRVVIDPVTGRRTFTNEPEPVAPASAVTVFGPPAPVVAPPAVAPPVVAPTPAPASAVTVFGPPAVAPARPVISRDAQGRIQRSAAARHAFARSTGFPNGRPGWIIDHIIPLACGGADAPKNMQWQTVAEAKVKDKTERVGCR